jgi:hypothetical protein
VSKRQHHVSYPEPRPAEARPLLPQELQERSRQAAELLRKWMSADDGYDEQIWPLVEEELTSSRTRIGSGE